MFYLLKAKCKLRANLNIVKKTLKTAFFSFIMKNSVKQLLKIEQVRCIGVIGLFW